MHDQLSHEEEAELEEAFSLPGAFDAPALGRRQSSEPSSPPSEAKEISLIASIIENLVSRFTLTVSAIRITLIVSENDEIDISVPSIVCNTQLEGGGAMRVAAITGLNVTWLTRSNYSSASSTSSSSMDEETTTLMSQSITCLQQAHMEESMYYSIPSLAAEESGAPRQHRHTVVSLESRPIVIQLSADFPISRSSDATSSLMVHMGVLGIALCPRHIAALAEAVNSVPRNSFSPGGEESDRPLSHNNSAFDITLDLQGMDLLILPDSTPQDVWDGAITPFLSKKSLLVPQTTHGLVQVRSILAHYRHPPLAPSSQSLSLTITEWTVTMGLSSGKDWLTFPILIPDPYLSTSGGHPDSRAKFDWLQGHSHFKPSLWRTRPQQTSNLDPQTPSFRASCTNSPSGITITVDMTPLKAFLDLDHYPLFLSALQEFHVLSSFFKHPQTPDNSATLRTPGHVRFTPEETPTSPASLEVTTRHTDSTTLPSQGSISMVSLHVPVIRVMIRVPSPPSCENHDRSGPMVVDLSSLRLHFDSASAATSYTLSWEALSVFASRTEGGRNATPN